MKNTLVRRIAFLSSVFAGALMWTNVASAQCDLYPIALSATTLNSATPGTVLTNLVAGNRSPDFAWLTWTGNQSDFALVRSLTGSGDSATYINPETGENANIAVDSLIVGQNEVGDFRLLRRTMNNLVGDVITVPVCDSSERIRVGSRRNAHFITVYHVVGFAQIQIMDYRLRGERDRLTVTFLDYVSCSSGPMD